MSMEGRIVLGMGNPLLDISAHVPAEFLEKYEVTLNNAILAEDKHLPVYQEIVDNYNAEYIAGGATQNSIRVCQWMLQVPSSTSYIGSVGDDAFGKQLRESATADGVSVHYHVDKDTATGTCAVLIRDHERSLIANLAAANKYDHEHLITTETEKVWKQAKYVYIAGFFLTVSPPSIMHLAQHCHENEDKTFIMNLAAPFIPQFFTDRLLEALPFCNIIVGNETEAEAFAKSQSMEDSSPSAVALALAAWPRKDESRERIAIVTQGAHPTLVVYKGELKEYPVPPVPTDELIDVNGAGDAFVGGVLAALVKGKDIDEAIRAGHYASGYIVRRSGCVLPDKPEFVF